MMDVLLISEKTLKSESYLNDNVDSCYVIPAITSAQMIGLQPILGTKLYNEIINQVKNNDIKSEYKILLDDYIKYYLIYKTLSEIQIPISFKNRNSGAVQTNNEYEVNSSIDEAFRLNGYYDNKSKFFANRLTDYLCANSNIYPEYRSTDSIADMKSDPVGYNTGIFLK